MNIQGYAGVFRNRTYTKLFAAILVSQIGSVTGLTAFAFYLLDRFANQPSYTTIAELMYSLPTLAVFFLTGVAADRFDRQKIAFWCDVACAVLSVALLGAIGLDVLPIVFALLFIRSAATKFIQPATAAMVRGVLSPEQYPTAIGINQMLSSMFIIVGSGLGAVCYWQLGIMGAVAIDAASFAVSAILIRSCKVSEEVRLPNGISDWREFRLPSVMGDFKEGLQYIGRNKIILSLFIGVVILGIINGGESVMKLFIMKYKLAPSAYEQMQVWLSGILAAGMFAGSLVSAKLARRMPLHRMITVSFMIMGCTHLVQAVTNETWLFLAAHLIYALSVPLCNIAFFGWLGQLIDPKLMGRVQGLIQPIMMVTMTVTQAFIAFAFPQVVQVEFLFYMVGVCEMILFAYYLIALSRAVSHKDHLAAGS